MMRESKRDYQKKVDEMDKSQFEVGNELGAELENDKSMHKEEYQKNSIRQNQKRIDNSVNKQNKNNR